jgi:hypothetical protein
MAEEQAKQAFAEWAILELMGHRRLAGRVQDVELFGTSMCRIDVPSDPPMTQFYGGSAIYCLTPTTESIARTLAAQAHAEPVSRYELPAGPTPLMICCDCEEDIPAGQAAVVVGPGRLRCAECQANLEDVEEGNLGDPADDEPEDLLP